MNYLYRFLMLESKPNKNILLFLPEMAEAKPTNGTNEPQDVNKEEDTPSVVRIYKEFVQYKFMANQNNLKQLRKINLEQIFKYEITVLKIQNLIIVRNYLFKINIWTSGFIYSQI